MSTFYASYPVVGAGGVPTYANLAAFPSAVTTGNGSLAIALDTDILYISNGAIWEALADPTVSPSAITALTGDVTATGPGSAAATIANLAVTNAKIANATINLTTKVTGTLPIANGGTNSAAALNNNRVMQSSGGAVVEAAAITASRALTSDANGIPVASVTTATELTYVNGVTSAIQTQLNGKQASGSYITALTGDVTASGPGSAAATIAALAVTNAKIANATIDLTAKVTNALPVANGGTNSAAALNNNRFIVSSGGAVVEASAVTASRAVVSDANGLPTAATTTATEIGFVNGVTSAIQTQLNAKVAGPGTSVDSEIAIFSGTGGQTVKRATGTGVVHATSGVYSVSNVVLTSEVTGTLPIANGGTSQTTKTAAYDALSPNTTKGDIEVFNGTNNVRLAVGTNGFALVADSAQTTGLKYAAVLTNPMTTTGDIIYSSDNSGTAARLGIGATASVLQVVSGVPAWVAVGTQVVASATGVGTVTTGYTTIASISLTAGTWDISCVLYTTSTALATGTLFGIATATNTNTGHVLGDNANGIASIQGQDIGGSIPQYRVVIGATTSYYLTARSTGANIASNNGRISAVLRA